MSLRIDVFYMTVHIFGVIVVQCFHLHNVVLVHCYTKSCYKHEGLKIYDIHASHDSLYLVSKGCTTREVFTMIVCAFEWGDHFSLSRAILLLIARANPRHRSASPKTCEQKPG